jgi:hypothetical protein
MTLRRRRAGGAPDGRRWQRSGGLHRHRQQRGDWTANTDDLTAASDVTTATFTDYPALTFTT